MTGFIQTMEVWSSSADEVLTQHDIWRKATEGQTTVRSVLICADRDQIGRYLVILHFDSFEDAMSNLEIPGSAAVPAGLSSISDMGKDPGFANLDVIRKA